MAKIENWLWSYSKSEQNKGRQNKGRALKKENKGQEKGDTMHVHCFFVAYAFQLGRDSVVCTSSEAGQAFLYSLKLGKPKRVLPGS